MPSVENPVPIRASSPPSGRKRASATSLGPQNGSVGGAVLVRAGEVEAAVGTHQEAPQPGRARLARRRAEAELREAEAAPAGAVEGAVQHAPVADGHQRAAGGHAEPGRVGGDHQALARGVVGDVHDRGRGEDRSVVDDDLTVEGEAEVGAAVVVEPRQGVSDVPGRGRVGRAGQHDALVGQDQQPLADVVVASRAVEVDLAVAAAVEARVERAVREEAHDQHVPLAPPLDEAAGEDAPVGVDRDVREAGLAAEEADQVLEREPAVRGEGVVVGAVGRGQAHHESRIRPGGAGVADDHRPRERVDVHRQAVVVLPPAQVERDPARGLELAGELHVERAGVLEVTGDGAVEVQVDRGVLPLGQRQHPIERVRGDGVGRDAAVDDPGDLDERPVRSGGPEIPPARSGPRLGERRDGQQGRDQPGGADHRGERTPAAQVRGRTDSPVQTQCGSAHRIPPRRGERGTTRPHDRLRASPPTGPLGAG